VDPGLLASFLNPHLCFCRLQRLGTLLLRSKSVILLVDSQYTEDIEAVKSWATLSTSPELNCFLREITSQARLWNSSQSVNLSTRSKRSPVLTWSSKWKTICIWCESRMSETMTSDSAQQYWAYHHFLQESNEWDMVVVKFWIHLYTANSVVLRLKG
jgi:hypothetical protein